MSQRIQGESIFNSCSRKLYRFLGNNYPYINSMIYYFYTALMSYLYHETYKSGHFKD